MIAVAEYRNLPKHLQNRPDVRSLTLRVYPTDDPHKFQVPGREKIYTLQRIDDEIRCDCLAAAYGRTCAHALALARYLQHTQPAALSAAKGTRA